VFRENGKVLVNVGSLSNATCPHGLGRSRYAPGLFPLQNLNGKPVLRIMEPSGVNWWVQWALAWWFQSVILITHLS